MVGRNTMDVPLRLRQRAERVQRQRARARRQRRGVEDAANDAEGALRLRTGHADVELGGANRAVLAMFEHELAPGERERGDVTLQLDERKSEVEKRADSHVAADPGKRVEIGPHVGAVSCPHDGRKHSSLQRFFAHDSVLHST